MTKQMPPLSILSIQITLLMMGFKLTCVVALRAHGTGIMHSQISSQHAAAARVAEVPTLPPEPNRQPSRAPAAVYLARFLDNASAEDIFKYTGTSAVFLCLSLTELAS